MARTLVTAPSGEPVTTAEAKSFLGVTVATHDDLIAELVTAARLQVEAATNRALLTQTYDLKLDCFPGGSIELLPAPLQSVTSITYVDTAGDTQTWAAAKYIVDAPSGPFAMPGKVALAYNQSYPSTRGIINAVAVRYVAGYGAAASVPATLKTLIKLLVGGAFQVRHPDLVSKRLGDLTLDFRTDGKSWSPSLQRLVVPFQVAA